MYFKRKELEKFRCFKGPLIDVRSPSEYYKGHMPNSINIPLFDDDERSIIGTIYKKEGRKKAVIEGLKFFEKKMELLLDNLFKSIESHTTIPNKNNELFINIEQLSIIKYIPEKNKLLFISNLDSFNIFNNNKKDKNPTKQDNFILIKDAILEYLGIDLGNNKLEDIYNNELIISTFENNKKLEDDILIIFKIKPEKTIDDLLNLPDKIDQVDEIISINRENKINFLKYIYRTDDNYIIASSDKK